MQKRTLVMKDTVIHIPFGESSIETNILFSKRKNIKGTILALPGWSYPASHWCDSTILCEIARDSGYHLIMPTIGKSIYMRQIYPETRQDWKDEITLDWLAYNFISYLQDSIGLFIEADSNYVIGISTGARGALLLVLERPELISGIALLSGDYDQNKFPLDNLYRGFFGSKEQFPSRYVGEENPMKKLNNLSCPVFMAHGLMDKVVNPDHSKHLFDSLSIVKPELNKIYMTESHSGHDYTFWNSKMTKVIDFFNDPK